MTLNVNTAEASPAAHALPPIDISLLLAFAKKRIGKTVDCDMVGTPITDVDTLLWGAYGPAVMRLVNLAVARHPEGPALDRTVLHALATEAFAQAIDLDFSKQPIQSYAILFQDEYGFGRQTAQLVELAREHAPVLRAARANILSTI